jgi:cell division protein FtsN
MSDQRTAPKPGNSGYAEEQPKTNTKKDLPDAKTPHEPQNVPSKKPKQ